MNKFAKMAIVVVLLGALGLVLAVKQGTFGFLLAAKQSASTPAEPCQPARDPAAPSLPRLVDVGADKCIPCKLMAPILKELKSEYAGRLTVEFIDAWKNPDAGKQYGVRLIPTQIFFDAEGKELFRHEGFFSKADILNKWKQLGVNLEPETPRISRLDPLKPDNRPAESICYMCDGNVDPKTRAAIKTEKGNVILCCPHCYFVTYSSLTDIQGMHEKLSVTDSSTGESIAATDAVYLYGMADSGRPVIRAFAQEQTALLERQKSGGSILNWQILQQKEMACRCGFCDRAVYPEDAALVRADGLYTWGCCPMCALGVAARTGKDIELFQKDALTGQRIRVKTLNGSIAELEPKPAVAWAGKRKLPDGKLASAGCFKQAFFSNEENLKTWLEQNPTATGMMISIDQALAAKMKLSPEQISKACKIGECAPK